MPVVTPCPFPPCSDERTPSAVTHEDRVALPIDGPAFEDRSVTPRRPGQLMPDRSRLPISSLAVHYVAGRLAYAAIVPPITAPAVMECDCGTPPAARADLPRLGQI